MGRGGGRRVMYAIGPKRRLLRPKCIRYREAKRIRPTRNASLAIVSGRMAAIVRTINDPFPLLVTGFMTAIRYDVLGIGNAIVDVIARTEDEFLIRQNMRKGGMQLIDEARADAIYEAMGPAIEISGGSAANTIVGVTSFGARAAFVGKVKDDQLGRVFTHDIRAAGVAFNTPPDADGPSTARSYILVTPDGERTMNTYLGAAQDLHPRDIDPDAIAG